MKITKKFLREVVLPYLKKYPKRYQILAYARRNERYLEDTELPKLDPAKPPPRGLDYSLEHLILMLHPDRIQTDSWIKVREHLRRLPRLVRNTADTVLSTLGSAVK